MGAGQGQEEGLSKGFTNLSWNTRIHASHINVTKYKLKFKFNNALSCQYMYSVNKITKTRLENSWGKLNSHAKNIPHD